MERGHSEGLQSPLVGAVSSSGRVRGPPSERGGLSTSHVPIDGEAVGDHLWDPGHLERP